jgi:hypothetical protein
VASESGAGDVLRREKEPNISKVIGVFFQKPPPPEKNGTYNFPNAQKIVKDIPFGKSV